MKYLFLLFLFPVILSAQVIEPEWTVFGDFEASDGYGELPILRLDSSHNVFVCGASYHPGPALGFITTKYDTEGNKLWASKHDTYGQDVIASAVTDNTDAVYIGGDAINVVTYKEVFKVFKYSPEGDTLWQYIYEPNKPEISSNIAQLILTPEQNILVVAGVYNALIPESKLLLVCLNPEGTVVWETTYKETNFGYSAIGARLMDGYYTVWAKRGYGFACLNVGLDGAILSTFPTTPYYDSFNSYFNIGQDGSLYLGDYLGDYKVTKYKNNGTLAWTYQKPHFALTNPFAVTARLSGIKADIDGNVFISGMNYPDTISGMISLTTKLDSNGTVLWEHSFYTQEDSFLYPSMGRIARWIGDSILIFSGNYTTNLQNNEHTYFLSFYNTNGFINGGISPVGTYKKNKITDLILDEQILYVCGISEDPDDDRQFLSKHTLSQYLTSGVSGGGGDKVQPITIQPNPSGGNAALVIDWVGAAAQGITEVFNIQGQGISAEIMQLSPGKNILPLRSAAQLPKGIYPVTLKVGGQVFAGKLVIQER